MAFAGLRTLLAGLAGLAVLALPGIGTGQAQMRAAPETNALYSPVPAQVWRAGLWDKPNDACMTRCEIFVQESCFRELSKKNPTADPASLQERCEDKYSLCLYKCMCDTCDENQIVIKQP